LQCENNFCHKCNTCLQVQNGSHLDTIEYRDVFIDDSRNLKINMIHDLVNRLSLTRQSAYKVALLESIERLTSDAANSFLKMLEEPPSRTIFIMTTSDLQAILPTIISRVRVIKFNSVSADYLKEHLLKMYPDSDLETITQASLFSLGKMGKAVQLMESPEMLAGYVKMYHEIQMFLERKSVADRFAYVENLCPPETKKSQDGQKKVRMFFEILSHVLRTKLLSSQENSPKYIKALSKIDEADILLKGNINARLVLENLLLTL
jgi:DNA polymerase III subunit delta'